MPKFNSKDKAMSTGAADTLNAMNPSLKDSNGKDDTVAKPGDDNSFVQASTLKEEKLPANVTNAKKVAELVGGASVDASGISHATLRASSAITFSGGADLVTGDKSAMVSATKPVKSGGRPERKLDTALMHVDDTPAETYKVPVKTIPNLTSSEGVGYNGVYRNEHAISGKGSGGSPKDGDFFRTVDMQEFDYMYFTHGQQNFAANETAEQIITTASYDESVAGKYTYTNHPLGNYTNDTLTVVFGVDAYSNAMVKSLSVSSTDHSSILNEDVSRLAGDAALRLRNANELDRLAMVDKASDENKENWSPLGMAIMNASGANAFMKLMDQTIGCYIALSGDKLGKALSFQINKSRKDGIRKVGPMFEMCHSLVPGVFSAGNVHPFNVRLHSFDNEAANIMADLFGSGKRQNLGAEGRYANARGSAALYVAYHDSLAKYNTKAKLLSLPLSFKTAYNTFKANAGVFNMTQTFANEYARQEVFGKLDEDATGITPYFMSDGVKLITPLALSEFGTITAATVHSKVIQYPAYPTTSMVLHHEDLRNTSYNYEVYNYLFAGLLDYFNRHANKIVDYLPATDTTGGNVECEWTLNIPIVSTIRGISMWDLVLCEALPDIVIHRKYALELLNKYEENNGYPYSDTIKADQLTTPNVGFVDINSTLQTKNIPLSTATRILLPETFTVVADRPQDDMAHGGTDHIFQLAKVILPWYFNQDQFKPSSFHYNPTIGGAYDIPYWAIKPMEGSKMTFFDTRSGVTLNNVDRVLNLDPEQLKLYMDRMVIYPGYLKNKLTYSANAHMFPKFNFEYGDEAVQAYKHALHDDGIPIVNYKAYASESAYINGCLSIEDIIAVPRELGLSFIAPEGVVTPTKAKNTVSGITKQYQKYRDYTDGYLSYSGPGFRTIAWAQILEPRNTELADPVSNKAQAATYKAGYYTIYANPVDAGTDIGILFNANARNSSGDLILQTVDKPFVDVTGDSAFDLSSATYNAGEAKTTSSEQSTLGFVNITKYLWNRLNILPYIVNPYDINTKYITATTVNDWASCCSFDPFEQLYLFNICGLRCGEYSQLENDRVQSRITRGLGYVEDPYIQRRS